MAKLRKLRNRLFMFFVLLLSYARVAVARILPSSLAPQQPSAKVFALTDAEWLQLRTISDRSNQSAEIYVTPGELARWILEKRQDYQLVDLRDPWQFEDYHIPGAVNIPYANLNDNVKRIDKRKKVIVYGPSASRAAHAQLQFSNKGYRAYVLEDGIAGWWNDIMTPSSLRATKPNPSGYQQERRLRDYFMSGGQAASAPPAVPPPIVTAAPAQASKPAAKASAKAPRNGRSTAKTTKEQPKPTKEQPKPAEKTKEPVKSADTAGEGGGDGDDLTGTGG